MNGHELQAAIGLHVGLGEQLVHLLAEPVEVVQGRALLDALQQTEIRGGVLQTGFIGAGRAPEVQPCGFDPIAQRPAGTVGERALQFRQNAIDSRGAVIA